MPRSRHQCHRIGCDSEATHELHLRLWFPGWGQVLPLDMRSTIKTCDQHRAAFMVWILSERKKVEIAAELARQGFGDPDFSSAEVEFVPLASIPAEFMGGMM